MEVKVLKEAGYQEALAGIGLSYGVTDFNKLEKVAFKLADKNGGHNKFLESMVVWIEINAARYWWQEFDTYRVGTTKQSASTIHTITRNHIKQVDFEHSVLDSTLIYINELIDSYNEDTNKKSKEKYFNLIKSNLPEGYLQKRIVCTNYKTLSNIIWQRSNHKLAEWQKFIKTIKNSLTYSELLFKK